MNNWIKVEDSLPAYSYPVLIINEDGHIQVGIRKSTDQWGENWEVKANATLPATHWQTLPEAPQ